MELFCLKYGIYYKNIRGYNINILLFNSIGYKIIKLLGDFKGNILFYKLIYIKKIENEKY